jgi:hypothetical protein
VAWAPLGLTQHSLADEAGTAAVVAALVCGDMEELEATVTVTLLLRDPLATATTTKRPLRMMAHTLLKVLKELLLTTRMAGKVLSPRIPQDRALSHTMGNTMDHALGRTMGRTTVAAAGSAIVDEANGTALVVVADSPFLRKEPSTCPR